MEDAQREFGDKLAIGRLGLELSDHRPLRLVVDSSVCGVNSRCCIPERTTLPKMSTVFTHYAIHLTRWWVSLWTSNLFTNWLLSGLLTVDFWVLLWMAIFTCTKWLHLVLRWVLIIGLDWGVLFFVASIIFFGGPMRVSCMSMTFSSYGRRRWHGLWRVYVVPSPKFSIFPFLGGKLNSDPGSNGLDGNFMSQLATWVFLNPKLTNWPSTFLPCANLLARPRNPGKNWWVYWTGSLKFFDWCVAGDLFYIGTFTISLQAITVLTPVIGNMWLHV